MIRNLLVAFSMAFLLASGAVYAQTDGGGDTPGQNGDQNGNQNGDQNEPAAANDDDNDNNSPKCEVVPGDVCTGANEALNDVEDTAFEGEIIVGQPLPEVVVIHEIPDQTDYSVARVNGRMILVEPDTRVVVEVVE